MMKTMLFDIGYVPNNMISWSLS